MRIPGSYFFRNLVERRALLYQLVRRDFQQRYVGSAAGWLWGLIHPLVLLLSWTFVFQICIKVSLPRGEVTQNYAMFLICGFLPWLLLQETVQRSASSMVEHANLITRTIFPAEMIPVSIFVSALVGHLFTLAIVIAAVAVTLKHFSVTVLLLPLYMLLLAMLAIGIGWFVAGLHVYVRDTAQVVTVVLTLWFWLTPIFIAPRTYPERVRFLLDWNPMAYLVRAYRDRLLSFRLPSAGEVFALAAFALAAFVLGGLTFRHLKRGFADVL
ncbi:MAG: ABC transporter permease [Bryobacteraceae bacterium]|nr:ABC transporter permease [Bryobacteraceae bacterium]